MMKKFVATTIVSAALGAGMLVQAQDKGPYDNAIKGRQAMFQTFGFNMGILGAMAKGEMDYDADLASQSASNLLAAANFGQAAMWPAGSDNETPGNARTRALPVIWENNVEVAEKFDALKQAAEVLAAQAGQGEGALKGAIGDVGASCKSCHDDFRAEAN